MRTGRQQDMRGTTTIPLKNDGHDAGAPPGQHKHHFLPRLRHQQLYVLKQIFKETTALTMCNYV